MSKLNKTIMFGAKIFEIAVWIYLAITLATAIAFIINSPDFLLTKVLQNKETHFAYGFFGSSLSVSGEKLIFMRKAYGIIKLTHIASIAFIALISRNIFLIFKTTEGKTKFSKGATPFQPRNIKMIKEIGYFYIAAPLVQSALNPYSSYVSQKALWR